MVLTYCVEQNSTGEANRFLGGQEISSILWNSKEHLYKRGKKLKLYH